MTEGLPSGVVLPQVDFELEQLSVVVLYKGPRRAEYSQEEAQRLENEHLQYTMGLAAHGFLLHAGALIDEDQTHALTGLGFSALPHDELARHIEKDPAIVAGVEAFKVVSHSFPKGGLAFPQATERAVGQ